MASELPENMSSMPPNIGGNSQKSPSLSRGVSTLGRKFSKRFEKFGDSETARKLRMVSPARKYHFSSNQISLPPTEKATSGSTATGSNMVVEKKSVSRVDSFRSFFIATSTSLKTPRAVKRRSRNHEKSRQTQTHADASTSTENSGGSGGLKKKPSRSGKIRNFGSELTLTDCNSEIGALSECQSEADLRGYCYTTDEDERSVVSEIPLNLNRRLRSSSGNIRKFITVEHLKLLSCYQ